MGSKTIGCEHCDDGNVYYYFVNHKTKTLMTDSAYCIFCYPHSTCSVGGNGYEEITTEEFDSLLQKGYSESES